MYCHWTAARLRGRTLTQPLDIIKRRKCPKYSLSVGEKTSTSVLHTKLWHTVPCLERSFIYWRHYAIARFLLGAPLESLLPVRFTIYYDAFYQLTNNYIYRLTGDKRVVFRWKYSAYTRIITRSFSDSNLARRKWRATQRMGKCLLSNIQPNKRFHLASA